MKNTTAKQSFNRNGVVLEETADVVVIATGLRTKSANAKTGNMIQIWILNRHMNPLEAIATGADATVCGDCKHRGELTVTVDGKLKVIGRRCYVQVDKAPRGIWLAYTKGRYRRVDASEYASLFGGRYVRFGAYGDPAFMSLDIIRLISAVCKGRTGYTHQWQNPAYAELKAYVMASVDTLAEAVKASLAGWRYFRVKAHGDTHLLPNEISCPASEEGGKRTTCANCRLCDGAKFGADEKRKSIAIIDHSRIAASQPLIQIG